MDEKIKGLVALGRTWWGKSWIKTMLKYGRFYRMQRAINYTKENRVSNVIIKEGEIFALCQGTAPTPYRVKIEFTPIVPEQWNKVIVEMSESILIEAKLLSGEMPQHINKLFLRDGVPLFPVPKQNLDATCNCPDEEVPCKHISAVVLTLASIFDYDPFMLFKLRGMSRKKLLSELQKISIGETSTNIEKLDESDVYEKKKHNINTFLSPDIERLRPIEFDISKLDANESIFHHLGTPLEINNRQFTTIMNSIYRDASKHANTLIYQKNTKTKKT